MAPEIHWQHLQQPKQLIASPVLPRFSRDELAVVTYLGYSVLNDLLVGHIALVADEQLIDALGSVPINLLKPLLDVVEGVHVGNIVDDADSVGATVVGRSDGTETLLAGGIPLNSFIRCRIGDDAVRSKYVRSGASQSCHRALLCGFSVFVTI